MPGALVQPDGKMSAMLADRVEQAARLWHAGKVKKVLVSGDHHTWAYDEPDTMRKALVARRGPRRGCLRGPRRLRHLGDDGAGPLDLRGARRGRRHPGLPHAARPLPRRRGGDRGDRADRRPAPLGHTRGARATSARCSPASRRSPTSPSTRRRWPARGSRSRPPTAAKAGARRRRPAPRRPARPVAVPRLERPERRFLTVDEIGDLADAIDPRYRLLVLVGAYGGLRLGELAALRVSSFGVGYRTLTVTETLTDVRGIIRIGPPKTRASVRTVTLPRFLAEQLEQHLSTMVDVGRFVFPAPEGGPLRVSAFRQRVWKPAVERAAIEWCTPHALRHSQVALLIEAGEQPLTIARRLGHTSVRVILDT